MTIICSSDRSRFLPRRRIAPAPPVQAVLTTVDGTKGYTNVAGDKTYTVTA